MSGPRLVTMPADSVSRLLVTIGDRHAAADRAADRWMYAGHPASPPLEGALTDLVRTVTTLRAVDRFRPRDGAGFGFDPPRATIELASAGHRTHIVLGELNAARSAVYARREDTPQVWLVGLYLVSALERVVYFASLEPSAPEALRSEDMPPAIRR